MINFNSFDQYAQTQQDRNTVINILSEYEQAKQLEDKVKFDRQRKSFPNYPITMNKSKNIMTEYPNIMNISDINGFSQAISMHNNIKKQDCNVKDELYTHLPILGVPIKKEPFDDGINS